MLVAILVLFIIAVLTAVICLVTLNLGYALTLVIVLGVLGIILLFLRLADPHDHHLGD